MPGADENKQLDNRLLTRMLQDFLNEAPEYIDLLNLKLVQLEKDPGDDELINEIFRAVHTIKGSASFVGLDQITQVSKKMESVLGEIRKGHMTVDDVVTKVLWEALDALTALMEKVKAKSGAEIPIAGVLNRLDNLLGNEISGLQSEAEQSEQERVDSQELLTIYMENYNQLSALKHIIYSSIHLSDPESLAVLLSRQIDEKMKPERNAIWLKVDDENVMEVSCDGELIKRDKRRLLEIESSEILKRVMLERLTIWASSRPGVNEMFPDFESPVLIPIKGQQDAVGFMALDPEDATDVEVYQFVGHFAGMILNISELHLKVEEQRRELDEMTGILFKQNSQLSSLYHVQQELTNITDPLQVCRIATEAIVTGLEARRAAAFLIDWNAQELMGTAESGPMDGIVSLRIPLADNEHILEAVNSGRIVSFRDYSEKMNLGPNVLQNWVVICFKGKEVSHGVLVVEIADEEIEDPISILANYTGILLENLDLEKRFMDGQ
jgi:HPt (histidine-containing phosphotransfer) domain-containing protein